MARKTRTGAAAARPAAHVSGSEVQTLIGADRVEPTEKAPTTSQLDPKEFGPLESKEHLYQQRFQSQKVHSEEEFVPYLAVLETYLQYLAIIIVGHIRDFYGRFFDEDYKTQLLPNDGYAPLLTDFDSFYTRRLKTRLADCFSRPTTGVPGRIITVAERVFKRNTYYELLDTGLSRDCVNLSSYNYLGFAQSKGQCTDAAEKFIKEKGVVAGGTRFGGGSLDEHAHTEEIVAKFLGKEAAMIYSMGYATNSNVFANLLDKKCLVISDELNHASIRTGLRLSGAVLKVFPHNDMDALEKLVRQQIAQGQPRNHRPWRKILIVVEGLYSMEGTMCNLPRLVELRDKYKLYLFVDEAHSVGAMGPTGRGIPDYFGISADKIDILMGTFTKSFGATGGYVAGSKELIDQLKINNMANVYGEAVTPPVLAQIQQSLLTIMGEVRPSEASERLQRLAFNARYLHIGLVKLGFIVSGHIDSPIVPLMLYHPAKMGIISRKLYQRNIAVVIVGYPATPLISSRIRFCLSSALTKSDLDYVLQCMEEVGEDLHLRVSRQRDKNGKLFRHSFDQIKDTLVQDALDPNFSF